VGHFARKPEIPTAPNPPAEGPHAIRGDVERAAGCLKQNDTQSEELPRILAVFVGHVRPCGHPTEQRRKTMVRFATMAIAAAVLILPAAAQTKGKSTTSPGKTQSTPGQQQKTPGGAKDFAPGQVQTAPGGAKSIAPGAGQRKSK
jgi:hypothetical protein